MKFNRNFFTYIFTQYLSVISKGLKIFTIAQASKCSFRKFVSIHFSTVIGQDAGRNSINKSDC